MAAMVMAGSVEREALLLAIREWRRLYRGASIFGEAFTLLVDVLDKQDGYLISECERLGVTSTEYAAWSADGGSEVGGSVVVGELAGIGSAASEVSGSGSAAGSAGSGSGSAACGQCDSAVVGGELPKFDKPAPKWNAKKQAIFLTPISELRPKKKVLPKRMPKKKKIDGP